MKKILGLILILCIILSLVAESFAAGKPVITKQPETSTTSKKGAVSFSISVKGTVDSYTWYFINPENGEKISGKKLSSVVKGVKVTSPNGKKITLTHVPDSMHGWSVYCHVNGNGYKVDSDTVTLLIYGMEAPSSETAAPLNTDDAKDKKTASDNEKPSDEDINSGTNTSSDAGRESGDEKAPASENTQPAAESTAETVPNDGSEEPMPELEKKTITVSSSSKVLLKLDSVGNIMDAEPSSRLEFDNTGSFLVRSDKPIKSWTVNGVRFEPAEPVNEFKVLNITEDIALDLKVVRATAASAEVDESHMCKVTCTGCTFTYLRNGLRSVTEGEVPAGAPIKVIADNSDLAAAGYRINGGEPENTGKSSFQLIVTDDTTIIAGN